jgi:RHS repeat-associated protein
MLSRTRGFFLLFCAALAFFSNTSFAATVPAGACLYALDSTASDAFQIAGATSVYTACGVVSESSSSSAFEMEGSETLYLQDHAQVSVVGSAQLNGQTKLWDTINNAQTQAVKVTSPGDPFSSLSAPTSGTIVSTSHASYDMNNKPHNNTLSPGVYCGGMTIGNTNGATFTFSPGLYVMAGGGLTLNSQAVVAGTGVTFYITSSSGWGCSGSSSYTPLTISGQVTANLTAPTSGAYDGILFFGNRTGCSTAGSCQDQINGGSTTVLNGALYFKSDEILITGSNASGYTMLVADKIYINGNSAFATNGSPFDGITVTVSPSSAGLNASQTQQFTATVANSSNSGVTWSISPSVGSISTSGVYTAPATITTQQTVAVTATSQDDTAKYGTATVTLYPPVSVAVSPTTATLYQGQTQQLTAVVANNPNTAVTWSISPAVGSISTSGLYTAPASVTASQTVTVKAISVADTTKSATATITLSPPIAVSVSPATATLYASQNQQLTATVTNTTNTAVTWSISPAGVGTVTTGGLYTAPANITTQQTVIVTATSVANTAVSSSATITLEPPVAVSGVSPSSAALYAGQTQTFSATVINTGNTAVTWSVSGAGSISSSGTYTAPSSITSQQTVTVTATSEANSAATATATITLYPPVAVSLTPTTSIDYANGTIQLSATVSNTSNTGVTWTLSGPGNISSSGLYTAPASVATQQNVTITATSQANPSASSSVTITLYPPITVSVNPATASVYSNGTQQFSATVSNATNTAVTWTVSGAGSISSSGLYTAPATIANQQTVTITATSQANSSASGTAIVMLLPPIAVSVTPTTATLTASQTQAFAATVANTSNSAVTWTISPMGVGTIDSTGLYTAPSSIAAQQTVTVIATSVADTTKSASVTVTLMGASGTLSETFGQALTNIDLTKEGTADWAVFGPTNYYNYGAPLTRKASVTPLIPVPSTPSAYSEENFLDSPGPFAFEDGYPDVQESGIAPVGMVTGSPAPEFDFTIPADTTQRTLKIYGSVQGSVQMTASLSDGSAPAISDTSFSNTGSTALGGQPYYYALTYNAASAGQTLTVKFVAQDGGYIYLNAATLTGSPVSVAPVVTSINPSSGSIGSMVAISGSNFGASQGPSTVTLGGVTAPVSSWSSSGQTIEVAVPAGAQSGPVQVVTNGGPSNTNVLFTLAPTVTSLSPSFGPAGTTVTISGSGFGTSEGTGSVTFNGVSATPSSWTDTQITVTVPAGATTGNVVVTQGVAATSTPLFTVLSGAVGTLYPVLQIGEHDSPSTINLSSSVNQDWIIWGADGATPAATREAQANLISDVTVLGGSSPSVTGLSGNLQYNYAWTNGTPTASGNIPMTGISVSGNNSGFQLTAPADTTVRTLKIYSYGNGLQSAQVNASISDGSSPAASFSLPYVVDYGNTLRVYSIDYRAGSSGQTVTVQLTSPSGVSIEAATLSPHLPQAEIVSPQEGQEFFLSQTAAVPFGVDATQFDSAVTTVAVSANGTQQFSMQTPFLSPWSPAQGHYSLQAQATDTAGLVNTSDVAHVDVIGAGGSLSIATSAPPSNGESADLTSEGTADWIIFGTPSNVVRKAGVGQLISNAKVLGDEAANEDQDYNLQFAYEDGTPNLQGSFYEGGLNLFNGAVVNNGYEITVKADTVPRTLRLYVGAEFGGGGKLKAYLSDGSAPVYVDTSLQATGNPFSVYTIYAIKFAAASAGQTLTVRWTMDSVTDSDGEVNLYAATLDGQPTIPTGPAIAQISPTSGGLGTSVTITGSGFGATQGASAVTFNGIAATPTSWTDTQIQVPAPASSNTGNIVVTVGGTASDPELFSMPPIITSLSATSVPVGGTLTLNGYNFGATQGPSSVWSYAGNATVLSWSDTQIQIVVPQLPSWACDDPVDCDTFVYVQTATTSSNVAYFAEISPFQIAPASASLSASQTQQYTLVVGGTPVSAPGITAWSIAPAGVGTIDQNGFYTAPAVVSSQQSITITGTVQGSSSSSSESATLTLNPLSVSIAPTSVEIGEGSTWQFNATIRGNPNTAVTWAISPSSAGAIDSAGLYTAPSSISAQQTVTVTATSLADPTKSASATITLYPTQCTTAPYSHRRILTIDHTKVPNTDQTDFPMLVSGTYPFLASAANGGEVQNANGYDIIFTSDPQGQVPLDFEIDSYNATTGAAAFWVRIPAISHTADTPIYMWYGNANIMTSQENKAGVWRNNFLSVYHLGDGSNLGLGDSGNAGYVLSGSATPVPGVIGGGAAFDGSSQLVHENVTAYPTGSSPVTIEGWVNTTANSPGGDVFGYGGNDASGSRVAIGSGPTNVSLEFENMALQVAPPSAGTWHHIVGVYGGGVLNTTTDSIYVDGVAQPESNITGLPAIETDEFKIGGIPTVWFCCFFTGSADEVRVSSGTRSADWVATEYNSESSPATFYSLSGEDAIAVNPASLTLYAAQSTQFTATPLSTCAPISWAIAPSGAGTITSGGLYTAPSTITVPQLVTVTATTANGPSESGSATVSLDPPITVTVTPASAAVVDGNQPVQLTATVANSSNTAVTWSVSPSGVGTISASGLYTAPQPLPSNQTVTVTATSQANPSISGAAILTLGLTGVVATPPSGTICAATGYTAQRMIVIDHTRVPNTDQINFPFLVSSTDPAFATTANGGKMMSYTGNDILFTLDPNGTEKLDYEIQSYDPVHGQITAWVRIPVLSHTADTVIYLFYGNPDITTSQANPTGVWDSSYQAVYHLANFSSSEVQDSTSRGNNAVASGVTPASGLFGASAAFDGSSSYIALPPTDFVGYPVNGDGYYTPFTATFQTWFKTTANKGLILEQDSGGGTPGGNLPQNWIDGLQINPSGNLWTEFFSGGVNTGGVYNDGQWHMASITVSPADTVTLYIDGQVAATNFIGFPFGGETGYADSYNYYLGTGSIGVWDFFQGNMEEVDISNNLRSSDWIVTQYNNQSSPSTFYKLYAAYPGDISLSPPLVSLYGGQSQQFVASATGSCVSPAVVWSGSAGMPGTLTADGFYLAPASIDTQQTVTLTATTVGDASTSLSATVTLLPPVSVSVAPLSGTLAVGQTQQLIATVSNTTDTGVTWTVNPAGAGSVSASGLYTAPATIGTNQTVNVTATSLADPSQSATATLVLTSPASVVPVSVAVNPASAVVYPGQSQQLIATVANTSNTAVSWQISPAGIGTISAAGVYTAPSSITTQQTVTVTATSQADPTQSAWAILTLAPSSCASSGYSYERTVTINHSQVQNTNQTNFPVLINTTDPLLATTANGGHVANANGYDIIFSADPNGITKLDYEVEQYNPVTGQVVAWVRVPTLSHTADTTIYLFYGNSSITASQQNPTGVWDINYLDVLHLDESTGAAVFDSTVNANNGTKVSQSSPTPISGGQMGGAQSFNGTSDYIVLPQPMTSGLQKFSVSFWTQTTDTNSNGTYWNQDQFVGDSTPGGSSGDFGVGTNSGYLSMWSGLNSANDNSLQASNYISDNNWHRIDAVNDGSIIHLYLDGSDTGQMLSSGLALDGYGWYLGAQHFTDGGAAFYHQGAIDEFRFSNSVRNADWIATEYNNERTPSAFYSLGAENVLAISPTSVSLFGGQSQQFAATGECTSNVTWSMPSGSPGTLTAGGLYIAPASVSSPQSVTLTATGQNGSTATATVNLLANISVTLTPSSVMLTANQSQQFAATVMNGSQGVMWSISPAGAGNISVNGLYTAPSSVTGQTVIVTATSVDNIAVSASATITLTATACVSNGYGYQRTIVIDHTKVPNTDQVNFPFLFNTTDPDLANFVNGGHVASANGYDIIFSLDPNGMTKLDHEIEQYNPATGQLVAWVRVPTLQHTADTVIYLFYGNPNVTAPQANSTGVWNSDYTAVYHMGGLGSSTAPDSTVFGNSGTLTSITPSTGVIDGAAAFDGTASYIQIPGADFPNYPTGQYSNYGTPMSATSTTFQATFGVWFKTTTAGGLLGQGNGSTCVAEIFGVCLIYGPTEPGIYDPAGWNAMLYVDTNGKVEASGITSPNVYNDNNWHYAVMTHATDGTKILYVDGENVGTQEQDYTYGYASSYIYYLGTAYTLLGYGGNWNWLYLNGGLDEVSISDIPRSADWIKTEFNNQSSPSTFYSLSTVGSLVLAPTTASLYASQAQQFVVGGQCSSGIGWTLSSGSPGTLSSTGLYTAPSIISTSQTVTITAANATTGTTIGSATITLLPVPSPITLAANAASPYTVGTGEIFTARLQDQAGVPEPGVSVTFTISGANAAIAKATSDSSGTATFTYAGSNSGADTIQASAVVNGVAVTSSALSVNWNLAVTPPAQASITLLSPPTLGQGGLMGAFTDSTGAVIEPVAIGASKTLLVPAGATQLQLGIDDTYFSDNGGTGYLVNVNRVPVTVAPTTMPWTWVARGLNSNLQYGFSDGTAPVVAATGLSAGQSVTIAYQSGTVSVGAAGRPFTNANGDQTQTTGTNISTGLYFPTLYTTASAYPVGEAIDWSALVTDSTGQPVANAPVTFVVNGVNPGQYSATTDSTGTATFAYTGTYAGTDTLLAQSGSLSSQTGNLVWQTYAPESTPSSLTITYFTTDVDLQDWILYATDASGNPIANANIGVFVTGVDNFQVAATTDITGHATFSYFHTNPGPYTIVAADSVNNTVVKTAPVSGTWTVPATGTSSPAGNQITINISTTTTIALPTNSVTLTTTITDSNGLTPTTAWTQVSGPGTVTFGDPTQASTTATFSQAGVYVLQLNASDTAYAVSQQVTITVDPPPVNNASQGWFGSPLYGSQATGIIPVMLGSGVTLTSGTLVYYPENDIFDVTVLNSNTTGSGQIGTFDTTQLPNGAYVLELYATNSQGVSQYNDITLNVVGNYKPGRVTSTITDLVVPATGLAISIQRQYDSLSAGTSSDFGYGWSLSTNVGLTVDAHNDVTFKLNGQTHTFFFTPQYVGGSFFQLGTYSVAFTPDSGIHGTLTDNGQGCPLDFVEPDGALWYCVGGGLYQPSGYIYTDPSGTQYIISAGGNLQSIADIGGNTLTVTANGITSSTGLSVPFVRDAQGRITKITDTQGNNYLYNYDASGNLATVTYPGVTQPSTYTYDPNHLYLSGTDFRNNPLPATGYYGPTDTDPNGLPLNGRLKSVQDGLGETTSYAYNLATNTTTVTYPPDGSGHVGTSTMVYDAQGNLLSSTDPNGLTTTNTYDATGNLLSVTDPLGHTNSYTYDANGNQTSSTYPQVTPGVSTTSTTTYNQYSAPTSATDELGNVRTFNYDANANLAGMTDTVNGQTASVVSSLYSQNGLLQAVAVGADITTTPSAASTFSYDAYGNVVSATDPLGKTTLYKYDSLGRVITMTRSAGSSTAASPQLSQSRQAAARISSGLLASRSPARALALPRLDPGSSSLPACNPIVQADYTITYIYSAMYGVSSEVDSLGRTAAAAYDGNGNMSSYTDANGNTYHYTYDALNRLTNVTLPTNPATGYNFTYDFRNNVVDTVDPEGHDRHNVYDPGGRLSSVTIGYGTPSATTTTYAYNNDGTLQSATDALGHTTQYSYDPAANLTQVTRGNVSVQYAYDADRNRISATDGNGNKTTFQYDARQRLQQIGFSDQTQQTIGYDSADNVTSVVDQAGHTVDYGYDASNSLVSVTQANSPYSSADTTATCRDGLGNVAWSADANGHVTTQTADALGRPTLLTYPDGTNGLSASYDGNSNLISLGKVSANGTPTATFGYDSLNRLTTETPDPSYGEPATSFTYTANGLLSSMTDSTGTTSYTYDALDRLTTKSTPAGALNYTYDAVGNVASMSASGGVSVSYMYDTLNRLSTVVDNALPAGHNTTSYSYDPASNLATATYPNGLQATFTYDQLNRLSQASTAVAGYQYGRDANGNILTATEGNSRSVSYSYDGLDELTGETVASDPYGINGSVSYSLDPVGNRLSDTSSLGPVGSFSTTYNADDQSQAETSDAVGDTIATGGKTFAYNSWLKLVSMNGGQVTLAYNGLGQLVAKTTGGVTTQYLTDDLSPTGYPQVVEEISGGAVQRTYTYGLERISELQTINNTPTVSFYQYDGRGTVRMLTDVSGAVTDTYEYDAFGNQISHTGTTPNAYLYRGERYDADLGLYYLRARWYNPATGRFMTRDPYQGSIYDPASLHRYNYARANPANFIDPSGRASAAEYGQIALNIFKNAVGVTAVQITASCMLYTVASSLQVLGDNPGLHLENYWANFKTCAAGVTWSQFGRLLAANVALFGAGEALGALGEWLDGAEAGEEPGFNCGECFAAGTPVHTDHGSVPIERIRVGDEVLARDNATGKIEYEKVTDLVPPHQDKLVDLRIEGDNSSLRPSTSHPFWVERGDRPAVWLQAGDIVVGDRVEDKDGDWHTVTAVVAEAASATVYNFTVDKDHDYFVGDEGFLVHNAPGDCGCGNLPSWITPGSLPPGEEESLLNTLGSIDNGTVPAGPTGIKWGSVFKNWAGDLPGGQGPASPYQEYRVDPGSPDAGTLRVVQNSTTGETYYTWTHYGDTGCPSFVRIR